MENPTTAGIIIIGNEILSGKVHDVNSHYLSCELRGLGVDVRRISVIPDDIEIIGREACDLSGKFDYVFTSGGVGPTHDDVTMEGIAKGFNVRLVEHPEIRKLLLSKYSGPANRALLKMTLVPEGSRIDFNENSRFPVVSFKNIYIFPGIPDYIKNKFSLIKERFRTSAFYLKKVYLNCHESDIAETLNNVVERNRDVTFGSYPVLGDPEYRVMITAEAKADSPLIKALDELLREIPGDLVVRVE